jgi:riboflavin synthase
MYRSEVFTGLIIEMGEIVSSQKRSGGMVLSVKSNTLAPTAQDGDSISVNGVCLTAVNKNNNILTFDLSKETITSTNLGMLKVGDKVNLEPSLSTTSKIGGHFVTGHVDGIGRICLKENIGDMMKIRIEAPQKIMKFFVEKGSVAVDGISLTIVDIFNDSFTVVIIPHTSKYTTIGLKTLGDTVNIEADIIGKYVAKFLNRDKNRDVTLMKTLTDEGYM